MNLKVGDTVRWVDDPNRRGTVLKVSDDLPSMVLIHWHPSKQWAGKLFQRWEAPELLVRIEP